MLVNMRAMDSKPRRANFWQIEAKLLVAAIAVGTVAAVLEGRFNLGGIAVSLGLTILVALGIGAGYRWLTGGKQPNQQ